MSSLLQKLPLVTEILFNGAYILLYSLSRSSRLPESWSGTLIGQVLEVSVIVVPMVLFFVVVVNYLNSKDLEDYLRKHIFSLIVFIPLLLTWGDQEFTFWLASAHLLASVMGLYEAKGPKEKKKKVNIPFVHKLKLKPAQLVLFSFFGIILLGTFFLKLPISSATGKSIDLIDAFFMATSATCVTGLATLPLDEVFSYWGQLIILLLIQIGGLGYMTLYTSMTIILGKGVGMKDKIILQDLLDVNTQEGLVEMIVSIVKYTFFVELWGAIILTIAFTFEGYEFSKAFYYGVFHSISAFCNAGFSLFPNSLESFATNPLIHGTISVLIIIGGMGFLVLKEIKYAVTHRQDFVRWSLHTKIVIVSSLFMITAGFLIIFFGEFLHGLDGYSLWEKIQVALFQSITLRTAGFNSIPLTQFHTYTLYFMTLFMFVGAGPGSTAGGIKLTTIAILVQSIKSTLKGREQVEFFDRKIPNGVIVRATALFIVSIFIACAFVFIMMKIEPDQNFLPIYFEVMSASGTVGLSLGITPYLSAAGKVAISLLMYIGRVGPLTLVLGIGQKHDSSGQFEYPEGRLMIG